MTSATTEPALDRPYEGAPFGAAYRRFWKKGFTFTGRASRAEFWRAWVATSGVVVVLYVISTIVSTAGLAAAMNSGSYSSYSTASGVSGFLLVVAVIYGLAIAIPSIAVTIRRLHDTNQSGAMYFVSFIPFIGGLILLFMLAQPARPEGSRFDLASVGYAAPPTPPAATSSYGEIPAPPTAAFAGAAPVVPPVPAPPAASAPSAPPVPPAPPAFAPAPFAGSAPLAGSAPAPAAPPAAAPAPLAPAPVAFTGVPGPVAPIPGIPGLSSVPAAPVATPVSAPDLDSTRMVPPSSPAGWTLELPDGRRVSVDGAVSLGRDPASEQGGTLVPIVDPARSMSKTHARFDLAGGGVTVTDLHSTNGTRIESEAASTVSVAPGSPTPVPEGATVVLGEYAVRLSRR